VRALVLRTLATNRKRTTVTQAAVARSIQTLDVHRGLAAKIAFNLIIAVDCFADLKNFSINQLFTTFSREGCDYSRRFPVRISLRSVNVAKRNYYTCVQGC
jgi:hypothetical protein